MAICDEAPKNTASRMLKIMIAYIKKHNKYKDIYKLISYQDTAVHAGTIYKASGWIEESKAKWTSWHNRADNAQHNCKRSDSQSTADKIRWAKQIRPEPDESKRRIKPKPKKEKPPTFEGFNF